MNLENIFLQDEHEHEKLDIFWLLCDCYCYSFSIIIILIKWAFEWKVLPGKHSWEEKGYMYQTVLHCFLCLPHMESAVVGGVWSVDVRFRVGSGIWLVGEKDCIRTKMSDLFGISM